MSTTAEILHQKFNPRNEQISPVRIKGFVRKNLAELFKELGFTYGAEVGVAEGKYSIVLCETIPNLHLLAVDLWNTYYRGDNPKAKIKDLNMQMEALALAHEKLDPYNVEFVRDYSVEASMKFENESLDFVYIDADHSFDYVMTDLIFWGRKVKPGGIISGHDAYRFRGAGVVDAVSTYTHCHFINEYYLCDEREISWFWAKQ